MTDPLRVRVYDLASAYGKGDFELLAQALDEHVDYASYAPVEVFPYLGRKHGRNAVVAAMRMLHAQLEVLSYQPALTVVEDDNAALMIMVRFKQRATGRVIQLLLAQFLRFRDDRIVELREFMDSFDAVEQVLGRHLELVPRS